MFSDKYTLDAVTSYVEKLPEKLKKDYGKAGSRGYSVAQILRAIDSENLSQDHLKFAVVIFGNDETLENMGLKPQDVDDLLSQLRSAIVEKNRSVLDTILDEIGKFLNKAGNIADGAGNSYI